MPGSARRRGKSWTAYWRDNGRQRSRGGFPTKRAALDYASRQAIAEKDGLGLVRSELTLRAYFNQWVASRHAIGDSTRITYRDALNRIPDAWATMRVRDLRDHHVQEIINQLVADGYASSTIRLTMRRLRQVLAIAVHERLLAVNPATSPIIEMPPMPNQRANILTPDQADAVFAELHDRSGGRYERLARFLLASQVRIGEAAALRWDDLDWDRCTVNIDRSVTGSLKTPASRRTITLDQTTMGMLATHREHQNVERQIAPIPQIATQIFTSIHGNPIAPRVAAQPIKSAGERAGVPWVHPHIFRHTGASWLLSAGVPVPIVAQRLGHSSPALTMSIYAHALPDDDQRAADAIGELMRRSGS